MKKISLSKGYFALVDDSDFEWLSKFKWHVAEDKKTSYARTYNVQTKEVSSMHRMILGLKDGDVIADHIDGNGLNNQRDNLRKASHTDNIVNRRTSGRSKYLGVFLNTSKYKDKVYIYWQTAIMRDGVNRHLGIYKNESDAAKAYNEAAKELHGEFARLNII